MLYYYFECMHMFLYNTLQFTDTYLILALNLKWGLRPSEWERNTGYIWEAPMFYLLTCIRVCVYNIVFLNKSHLIFIQKKLFNWKKFTSSNFGTQTILQRTITILQNTSYTWQGTHGHSVKWMYPQSTAIIEHKSLR